MFQIECIKLVDRTASAGAGTAQEARGFLSIDLYPFPALRDQMDCFIRSGLENVIFSPLHAWVNDKRGFGICTRMENRFSISLFLFPPDEKTNVGAENRTKKLLRASVSCAYFQNLFSFSPKREAFREEEFSPGAIPTHSTIRNRLLTNLHEYRTNGARIWFFKSSEYRWLFCSHHRKASGGYDIISHPAFHSSPTPHPYMQLNLSNAADN